MLLVTQVAVQPFSHAPAGGEHAIQRRQRILRPRQLHEESNAGEFLLFHGLDIEGTRLHRVGHGEFRIFVALSMTMEDVHLAEAQAAFQQIAEHRLAVETIRAARDQMEHDHFLHLPFRRWRVTMGLAGFGTGPRGLTSRLRFRFQLILRQIPARAHGRQRLFRLRLGLIFEQILLLRPPSGHVVRCLIFFHHDRRVIAIFRQRRAIGAATDHPGTTDHFRVAVEKIVFFIIVTGGTTETAIDAHTQAPVPFADHSSHTVGQNQQNQNNQNADQCFQIQAHLPLP